MKYWMVLVVLVVCNNMSSAIKESEYMPCGMERYQNICWFNAAMQLLAPTQLIQELRQMDDTCFADRPFSKELKDFYTTYFTAGSPLRGVDICPSITKFKEVLTEMGIKGKSPADADARKKRMDRIFQVGIFNGLHDVIGAFVEALEKELPYTKDTTLCSLHAMQPMQIKSISSSTAPDGKTKREETVSERIIFLLAPSFKNVHAALASTFENTSGTHNNIWLKKEEYITVLGNFCMLDTAYPYSLSFTVNLSLKQFLAPGVDEEAEYDLVAFVMHAYRYRSRTLSVD